MSRVYNHVWARVRLEIMARDAWMCQIRGPRCKVMATDVDHIVPIRAGGAEYDPRNLRAACSRCNRGRGWREPKRRASREW